MILPLKSVLQFNELLQYLDQHNEINVLYCCWKVLSIFTNCWMSPTIFGPTIKLHKNVLCCPNTKKCFSFLLRYNIVTEFMIDTFTNAVQWRGGGWGSWMDTILDMIDNFLCKTCHKFYLKISEYWQKYLKFHLWVGVVGGVRTTMQAAGDYDGTGGRC